MADTEIEAVLAELDDDDVPLYEHATTYERLEDCRAIAERAAAEILRLRALLAEASSDGGPHPVQMFQGVAYGAGICVPCGHEIGAIDIEPGDTADPAGGEARSDGR